VGDGEGSGDTSGYHLDGLRMGMGWSTEVGVGLQSRVRQGQGHLLSIIFLSSLP
jgi:hypothetical protein